MKEYMNGIDEAGIVALCARVKDLIEDTFDDSARRFDPELSMANEYIFLDHPFSIDCQMHYVTNPVQARLANPNFSEPYLWINLLWGSQFDQEENV